MRTSMTVWNAAVVLSVISLLSFLARTFLDFAFVYQELHLGIPSFGLAILLNLAFVGGWVWGLLSASHERRRGMVALLVYDLILVLFGIATLMSFCPSPCRTAWPIGEMSIWSNLVIGVPASIAAFLSLVRR